MESAARDFLVKLLETPSPSGYERPIQDVVRAYVADFADSVTTDLHGNVIAAKRLDAKFRVMLAGHCDQIGMLVSHFNDNGFLHAQTIGGWDPQQLIGQRMIIWTAGGPLPAVISRKPIHLLTEEERKQVVKLEDMWLDIGAKSKDEAKELVRIGDPVTLQLAYQEMRSGLANSPAMDNKCGLWVVLEALRRVAQQDVTAKQDLKVAQNHESPHQLAASGRAQSNDSNPLQISRAGVATGLVAIPNRYMHSAVEMISLDDIDRAADLLAAFVTSLTGEEDFRP